MLCAFDIVGTARTTPHGTSNDTHDASATYSSNIECLCGYLDTFDVPATTLGVSESSVQTMPLRLELEAAFFLQSEQFTEWI